MERANEVHVSAVICTRNRDDKIGTAVASVLANDYPSFDLTIIDQSTTEATRKVVEAIDDPRLRYVHSNRARALAGVQQRDPPHRWRDPRLHGRRLHRPAGLDEQHRRSVHRRARRRPAVRSGTSCRHQ